MEHSLEEQGFWLGSIKKQKPASGMLAFGNPKRIAIRLGMHPETKRLSLDRHWANGRK